MAPTLTDCRRLLDAISGCGVQPPQQLTALIESCDAIADTGSATSAVDQLVKNVLDNQLRGKQLTNAIAAAATADTAIQFRKGLEQRVEVAVTHRFVRELDHGAADEVIAALSPAFDEAAAALVRAGELIDATVDPVTFLETANDEERRIWTGIKPNLDIVQKIAAVAVEFGSKSLNGFSMIELPTQVGPTAWLSDFALMCTDPKFDLQTASAAFNAPGTGRASPWFRAASALRLSTIGEARERVRHWAENAWDSLGLNTGRGRLDPVAGFVAEPVENPFRKTVNA